MYTLKVINDLVELNDKVVDDSMKNEADRLY